MFRSFLALSLSISVSNADSIKFDDDRKQFLQWMSDFKREYESDGLKETAFEVWRKNRDYVNAINDANLSWKASIQTKYSDMTVEEFQKKVLLSNPLNVDSFNSVLKNKKKERFSPASFAIQDSYDWREHGAVTPVQDQGTVGTCWAFSTVGNIEGQYFLNNNTLTKLSEEYIVDCDGSHDDKHADCGVFGGWPYLAYDFVIDAHGLPTEAAYPYCAGNGECYPCMQGPYSLCGPPPYYCDEDIEKEKCPASAQDMVASIQSWSAIDTNEEAIASSLASIGPLSVLLDASGLQFYSSGVWTGYREGTSPLLGCSKQYLDHAVLLVGYGTDNGVDYWTVKNSWGESWGEDGYFRITRGEGTCGINTAVTTSFM